MGKPREFIAECADCQKEAKYPRRGEVVFDKEQGEYVVLRRPEVGRERRRAVVFNPRCGEEYYTSIRLLNKREKGTR